jgi:secreted trypsin-like serine protease
MKNHRFHARRRQRFWFALLFALLSLASGARFVRARPTPPPTPPSPRIIGGDLASAGEYPWQAALVDAGTDNPRAGQYCGATLIHPYWVLTAAHCMFDINNDDLSAPEEIDVVVGVNQLSAAPRNGLQGQRLKVDRIIVHPNFSLSTLDSDLALLHLTTPAALSATVALIPLASSADVALFAPGANAVTTGWGLLDDFETYPDQLYKVTVPIVTAEACRTSYGEGMITGNMLCAGLAAGGKDSCAGDSGGPLIVPDGSGGWLQAGIVSWGNGCARPNYYGVYTRLANFKPWIFQQITAGLNPLFLPFIGVETTFP